MESTTTQMNKSDRTVWNAAHPAIAKVWDRDCGRTGRGERSHGSGQDGDRGA